MTPEDEKNIKETFLKVSEALLTHKEALIEQKDKLLTLEESLKSPKADLDKCKADIVELELDLDILRAARDKQREKIEKLFSLRRYEKASVITNVALILLLLVYLGNEVVKFFS